MQPDFLKTCFFQQPRLASGKRCSFYLVDSFIIPTRDASPPLVLEFVLAFSACV